MKKVLVVLLTLMVLSLDVYARAGASSSGGSMSSSSSSSRTTTSTSSFGTKANSAPAATQYSSKATAPITSSSVPSTGASTKTTSNSQPYSTATQPTALSSGYASQGRTTIINNGGGTAGGFGGGGFGSSFLGSIAGVGVGEMLFGNHNNSGGYNGGSQQSNGVPSNGIAATNQAGEIQSSGVTVVQERQSSSSFWSYLVWFFLLLLKIAILLTLVYGIYRLHKYIKTRRTMNSPEKRDRNLPKFSKMFIDIQNFVSNNDTASRAKLGTMCTTEIYDWFLNVKSENEETNTINIVEDVKVLDITTRQYEVDEDTGDIYHSVKIRFSMIDFYIDSTTKEITDGSKETPVTDIEVWTFASKDAGKNWKLSAVEQYVK